MKSINCSYMSSDTSVTSLPKAASKSRTRRCESVAVSCAFFHHSSMVAFFRLACHEGWEIIAISAGFFHVCGFGSYVDENCLHSEKPHSVRDATTNRQGRIPTECGWIFGLLFSTERCIPNGMRWHFSLLTRNSLLSILTDLRACFFPKIPRFYHQRRRFYPLR